MDENTDDQKQVGVISKFTPIQRKKIKNDEIVIDDFSLIEILGCSGFCDKTSGFLVEPNVTRPHPLFVSINQYLRNPKAALKTCNMTFAKFLIELAKVSNERFYSMCSSILRMLHECLNLYGYHFLIKLEQQNKNLGKILNEDLQQDSFCEKENSEYISVIFDFFVKCYIKNYLRSSDFEFDFTIKFLKYFNSWLFKYQLSKVEICFNSCN